MSEQIAAAVMRKYGTPPEFASFDTPPPPSDGQLLVEVEVGGLNPVDIALGEQRYYLPSPPLPYVPGLEAVGRVPQTLQRLQAGGELLRPIAHRDDDRNRGWRLPEPRPELDQPELAEPAQEAALGG